MEDRKRLLFITRLIGSAVDTRETSTRQAKELEDNKQAVTLSLPLNLNLVGIPAKNELNRVWLSPSVHPYKELILVQSGVDSLTTSSANRDLLERVIESSLIPRFNFANRLVKARKR